jgi:hypothetical protein
MEVFDRSADKGTPPASLNYNIPGTGSAPGAQFAHGLVQTCIVRLGSSLFTCDVGGLIG